MRENEKFRVFISHKKSDEDGSETRDSLLAQQIHSTLVSRGISTFLAQYSILELGQTEYMRSIDAALEQTELLVVIATHRDHLESQWVRYEWESFVNDILSGRKSNGRIFSYIDGFSVNDLPRPLRLHQAMTHGDNQIEKLFQSISTALGVSALGKVAERGDRIVDRFDKMMKLVAESHIIEMEIFAGNPMSQMVMSENQQDRMKQLILEMRQLIDK